MAMNLKSSEYVLPLADRQATLETVGGKGASSPPACQCPTAFT
jgi:hypothetical protein